MGPGASMMEMGILAMIIGLMVVGLIGSVGGTLGWLIWAKGF
jgi:Flp pilus assembly pilin Flp